LNAEGAEVDWFVGYQPPAENFQASLEKILRGDGTFQSLQAAYAANPKDAATVFKIARKWSERYDRDKAQEKYREVIALDPEGKGGSFTDDDLHITAPYTAFARLEIAAASFGGPKPDPAAIKAFIAENPGSPLVREAYARMAPYYLNRAGKDDADAFFAELTARFPGDPQALATWLSRVLRDRGPADKAAELAGRLWALSGSGFQPRSFQLIAQAYDLAGDKAKVSESYGKGYMEGQVESLAYSLLTYANFWADRKENLESAESMAEKALKLQSGSDEAYFVRSVAGVYVKAGDDAKALDLFGPAWLAKKSAVGSAEDMNGYASFWSRQGKNLESAQAAARKTVELDPKVYYYWSTLSEVLAKLDKKTDAIKAAEKALELAPSASKITIQRKLDALKAPSPEKK
jgi:tetratricopeptide (TPR) repeat protein